MAGEIAGRPHWEVGFDERGTPNQGEVNALLSELPGRDLTDLLVLAHGWNSDRGQARRLYQLYFQQVPGCSPRGQPGAGRHPRGGVAVQALGRRARAGRRPGRRGRGRPRRRRPGGPARRPGPGRGPQGRLPGRRPAPGPGRAGPAAGRAARGPGRPGPVPDPDGELATTPDADPAGEDQGETALLEDTPEEVFGRFADAVPRTGEGGAAGLGDAFGRLWNGAKEALRQLTYFEMKKRAGVVGKESLGRCWAASTRPTRSCGCT